MRCKGITGGLTILGMALVVVSVVALVAARPVTAQCGSQASSCKNCHETQAQDPVNADGTGWHESHAFGDFCYICHGGNSQAAHADAAHAGMVAPMADVQTACAQCHPDDLQARSDVYTVALGILPVSIGAPAAATKETWISPEPAEPLAPALSPEDPNLVDYVARYNQQVLKQRPTSWGNIILIVVLVALLAAGLFFVNRREGWISVSFVEKRSLSKEYPEDVIGIADGAMRLGAAARKSLARLLTRPAAAAQLLRALDGFFADESSGEKQ